MALNTYICGGRTIFRTIFSGLWARHFLPFFSPGLWAGHALTSSFHLSATSTCPLPLTFARFERNNLRVSFYLKNKANKKCFLCLPSVQLLFWTRDWSWWQDGVTCYRQLTSCSWHQFDDCCLVISPVFICLSTQITERQLNVLRSVWRYPNC